jgi:hypothetical protein
MIGACEKCGCTAEEAIANAKSLSFEQEFESGAYTCCQLAGWAHESWRRGWNLREKMRKRCSYPFDVLPGSGGPDKLAP